MISQSLDRFDAWVERGPFTTEDLGRYRVVFALSLLVGLTSFDWVAGYPDSLYRPPVGPFRAFDGFPSRGVLYLLELALAVSLAALALGVRTRLASACVAVLLLTGSGFAFSLGKIDHTIFQILVPAVLLLASWGAAVSVDGLGRRRERGEQHQWPLRLLALLVGAGLLTAALPKAFSGWLSPATQAVQESMLRQFYVNGRTELLAPYFVHLDSPLFWESLDWATVIMEAAVILCVLNWRAFRVALAVLVLFHVGVYLMMNINFAGNVLVYGAFVSWSRVKLPPVPSGVSRAVARAAWPIAAVTGTLSWALSQSATPLYAAKSVVLLALGSLVAVGYLVTQGREVLALSRSRWPRRAAPTPPVTDSRPTDLEPLR